jgi:hypothetical protein
MKVRVVERDIFGKEKNSKVIQLVGTQEEKFSQYFKLVNKFKYCNSISHKMLDKDLHAEYKKWLTFSKYVELGGDPW